MAKLVYPEESYKIMGACFEVYREKGCGFHEATYQECLEIELALQGIPFEAKKKLRLTYKGHELSTSFVPDLVCYGKIVVELKAVDTLADAHEAQVLNYLHATGMQLGLLVNFGHYPKLQARRIALTERRARSTA